MIHVQLIYMIMVFFSNNGLITRFLLFIYLLLLWFYQYYRNFFYFIWSFIVFVYVMYVYTWVLGVGGALKIAT